MGKGFQAHIDRGRKDNGATGTKREQGFWLVASGVGIEGLGFGIWGSGRLETKLSRLGLWGLGFGVSVRVCGRLGPCRV